MTEAARPAEHAEPTLRLRGVGRRFGGVHAVRDVDLDVAHGERRAILGPNGAGKTTLFNLDLRATSRRRAGRSSSSARTSRELLRGRASKLGLARTYQKSRLFLGLTVEDNIYLAIVGVEGGRLRPRACSGATRRCASARVRRAEPRRDRPQAPRASSATSRTASSGSSRSAMALAAEPQLLMLDEPAPGSRAASASCSPSSCSALAAASHADPDRARHGRRAPRRRAA